MTRKKIGDVEDFPQRKGVPVDVDGIAIAVFRIDDEFFGIQNRCVHKNLPLHLAGHERVVSAELLETFGFDSDPKEDVRGRINADCASINCPWHLLEWDLESGSNDVMDVSIATYDIEVQDDEVFVLL